MSKHGENKREKNEEEFLESILAPIFLFNPLSFPFNFSHFYWNAIPQYFKYDSKNNCWMVLVVIAHLRTKLVYINI